MIGKMLKNKKGFTLIELIAVIAILGIILILALPQVGKIQEANKNRKYEVYEMSIERGAKLYVDSRARDLFGNNNSGCVTIKYSELKASNVIKDFGMDDVTCSNDSETYVEVRKINNDYRYDVAIICRQGGETGKIVHKKTIDDSFTCSINPDVEPPTVEVSPSSNSDWINPEELSVKIKISDESGLNKNIGIKYYWVNNAGEKVSKDFTYNYNNKKGVTKVSYKIPENNMKGVSGEVYLVVEPYRSTNTNGIQDVLGNEKSIAQQEGPYKLDGTKPSCGTATGAKDTWTNQNFTISQQCIDNESGCVKDTYEKTFTSSTTTYTFTIKDKAGNTNECKVDVYLDKDKPECGKIEGESTKWTNGNRTISAKCKDEKTGDCSKDKFEVTFTTDGKTDNIEISDKAGNTVSCKVDKYIDKTPPTCTSSGGSSEPVIGPVTITGTCKDSLSGCTGNVSKKLTDDMNTSVSPGTVKDNAGNTTKCPAEPVNINTTPNKPTIINPTNGNWVNYNFALTVKTTMASNLISHWQYSYDNSSWTTYENSATNNFKTTNFTKERNQLVYIRVCNTNNVCSEAASTYIRIDKTPPACPSISSSIAANTWTNQNITFNFGFSSDTTKYIWYTKTRASSGWQDWIDWGENNTGTTSKTISGEGLRKVGVRVYDAVGNSQLCGDDPTYKIDKTPPYTPYLDRNATAVLDGVVVLANVYGKCDAACFAVEPGRQNSVILQQNGTPCFEQLDCNVSPHSKSVGKCYFSKKWPCGDHQWTAEDDYSNAADVSGIKSIDRLSFKDHGCLNERNQGDYSETHYHAVDNAGNVSADLKVTILNTALYPTAANHYEVRDYEWKLKSGHTRPERQDSSCFS